MGFAQTFFKKKKGTNNNPTDANASHENPSFEPFSSSFRSQKTNIEELEQVFKKFDVNGDGKISSSELGSIMGSLGQQVTEEDLQTMIKEVDADGDGFINFNEFVTLNTNGIDSDEVLFNLKETFSIYDVDGNGKITLEELQMVMKSLGDDFSLGECKRMINGVDSDGDGTINFEEFKDMMMMGARLNTMTID
ncbi:probable calcium-binding protein CML25 [Chenopodium quinoa]|uniref:EF-hand domain-containing protein n=1 Tax=Chenopodium quinoa TaxID=63459 RepID=A0A803M2F8_CHEQI|nr:probable calcium-binding protein CML25 [Chenopodium quinoa]